MSECTATYEAYPASVEKSCHDYQSTAPSLECASYIEPANGTTQSLENVYQPLNSHQQFYFGKASCQDQSVSLGHRASKPALKARSQKYCKDPLSSYASMITSHVLPKEIAAHEASDFKNVKGVYKNCRGIWAAQWTDERGQRHTKYFNPKYFKTEAAARHEAFCFKIKIAREIELRGGVKKKRSIVSQHCRADPSFLLFGPSYVQNRRNHNDRSVAANRLYTTDSFLPSQDGSNIYKQKFDQLNSPYIQNSHPGNLQSSSNMYSEKDYLQEQNVMQDYQPYYDCGDIISQLENYTNSTASTASNSLNSSPQPWNSCDYSRYYYPITPIIDSINASPPKGPSHTSMPPHHTTNSSIQSQQYTTDAMSSCQVNDPSGYTYQLPTASTSSLQPNAYETSHKAQNSQIYPATTAYCICGCASLALLPATYASHHRLNPPSKKKPEDFQNILGIPESSKVGLLSSQMNIDETNPFSLLMSISGSKNNDTNNPTPLVINSKNKNILKYASSSYPLIQDAEDRDDDDDEEDDFNNL